MEKSNKIQFGEFILDELKAQKLSKKDLAKTLRISGDTLNQIIDGKKEINGASAKVLGRFFNTSAEMWLNLYKDCNKKIKAG